MGDRKGAYRILVGNPERRRLLIRPRNRWKDNIKWIFTNWDEAWTVLIWLRTGTAFVNAVMNFRGP